MLALPKRTMLLSLPLSSLARRLLSAVTSVSTGRSARCTPVFEEHTEKAKSDDVWRGSDQHVPRCAVHHYEISDLCGAKAGIR